MKRTEFTGTELMKTFIPIEHLDKYTRLTYKDIAQALARGYCHPSTEKLVLDPSLITAMSHEIVELLEKKGTMVNFNTDSD